MEIIVGTAGHIDHGKTALVKALTGVDADRLPEEKLRGITIDLGFAELDLGDVRIGFVDVPGHEKFVKNMLAGAHGIDMVALVIAANEGVMPQTREHFDICRLLETKAGLIILTKTDLVDDELLELVQLDAAELVKDSFLENAPVIPVSAKTGLGLAKLKETLRGAALAIPARQNESVTRLPVDRIFSIKGFGTVVTGTLVSGEIAAGDELEILPLRKKARVRSLQVHEKPVEKAFAGQRTAVNLGGIETSEIERGMLLATAGILRPTQSIDVEIEILPDAAKPLKSRQRVRVHLGTAEILARVQVINETGEIPPGQKGFAQLRLESPASSVLNARFVIRSYSPQVTIAGGKVLDCLAARHRRRDFPGVQKWLAQLSAAAGDHDRSAGLRLFTENSVQRGLSENDLQALTGWRTSILKETLAALAAENFVENSTKNYLVDAGGIYLSARHFADLAEKTFSAVEDHHKKEPLSRGISKETLRERLFAHLPDEVFRKTLAELETGGKIVAEKDVIRAAARGTALSPADEDLRQNLLKIYTDAGLEVPGVNTALSQAAQTASQAASKAVSPEHARKILQLLLDSRELVGVTNELLFHRDQIARVIKKIKDHASGTPDRLLDVAVFKELTGVSRKYAIPLLEYFDREKITRRAGDKRLVM